MKKSRLIMIIICLFILANTASGSKLKTGENNDIINIVFNNNTLYVGGHGDGNYSKIQDAIDNASDGDTIFVYNGTYNLTETIFLNKSINLIGENKSNTKIDSINCGTAIYVFADNSNISGFTIINNNESIDRNYNMVGIWITPHADYTNISNNIISRHYAGIHMASDSNHNRIFNNIIAENSDTLTQHFIGHDGAGILLFNNKENEIFGNNIDYNGNGIYLITSEKNHIYNNIILNSENIGISVDRSHSNTIRNNEINNSSRGVLISEGNENIVHNNNISYCFIGVELEEKSYKNNIHHNNLFNCMTMAYTNHAPFNKWRRNYWGRPRILPKPIFGLIGYFDNSLITDFDWFPALRPYI